MTQTCVQNTISHRSTEFQRTSEIFSPKISRKSHLEASSNRNCKTPGVKAPAHTCQPSKVERNLSPLSARWNSRDTEDPRVADSVARCHLRWFRGETQHAHLTDVAVAVAHPNVPGTLSIGQGGRSAGELQASSSLSYRQRSHKFWAGPPISGQCCKSRHIGRGEKYTSF